MKCKSDIVARYAETDQMGIVHHSVYPVWFEVGRTDFIKMLGITYTQLEKNGVMMPLVSLECKYIIPVKYEDRVTVETAVRSIRAAKIEFHYRVIRDGTLCAEGATVHGFVNSGTFAPVNMKKFDPKLYELLSSAITE